MTELRVLTVRQPWASLIALGHKRIEVRSRPTKYRGWVAIHAAKAKPTRWWETAWREDVPPDGHWLTIPEAWRLDSAEYENTESGDGDWYSHDFYGPLGAVVAVARLTDSLPILDARTPGENPVGAVLWHRREALFVDTGPQSKDPGTLVDVADQLPYAPAEMWTPGHHGWMLDDVRPLDHPIQHKGGLGLRYPTLDLAQRLAPHCAEEAS